MSTVVIGRISVRKLDAMGVDTSHRRGDQVYLGSGADVPQMTWGLECDRCKDGHPAEVWAVCWIGGAHAQCMHAAQATVRDTLAWRSETGDNNAFHALCTPGAWSRPWKGGPRGQ